MGRGMNSERITEEQNDGIWEAEEHPSPSPQHSHPLRGGVYRCGRRVINNKDSPSIITITMLEGDHVEEYQVNEKWGKTQDECG